MAKSAVSMNPTRDDFMSLLDESYADRPVSEGSVVKGKVLAIENELVIIDVGLKTEGRVPLKEFSQPGKDIVLKAGDTVEVYLERIESQARRSLDTP
jgi:small subunit ribosomal protein S1